MVLQQRTDNLSKGLLEVHKLIQNWDDRLEKLIPAPRSKVGLKRICVKRELESITY